MTRCIGRYMQATGPGRHMHATGAGRELSA